MIALPGAAFVRLLIGLFFVDLVRWVWKGEPPPAPRSWDTRCAWCGEIWISFAEPATPTTPPPFWARCDPARGLGERVWWCSLRCQVEHGNFDDRITATADDDFSI